METKQTTDTSALEAQLLAEFEAFKSANDERVAAIEAKTADVLLDEKVARIDRSLAETKSALDRLAMKAALPVVDDERETVPQGWSAYLRAGDERGVSRLDTKSLNLGDDTEGGYLAPPQLDRMIEARLLSASPMRQIATVRQTSVGTFKKPVSLGAAAAWAAEEGARAETTAPTLSLLDFPAAELYAMPAATQALLDDSFVDVDEWLADEVQDAFSAQENTAFVSGTGTNQPRGILSYTETANASQSWGEIGYIASGAAGDFATGEEVDRLLDLIYALKPGFRGNARFVMNRRSLSTLRKVKDGDGRYIFAPGLGGEAASLLGFPVTEMEDMPDIAADATPIAFGDFRKGYLIVDRQGARVLRDPYSAKPYVLFYTTKRVGGGVQNFDAIKVLKMSAS
ncbi:MAG: phage major capsid protein [Ponticaulis sp.]|nr:phage major capsid protein [Ponticaulis sp.]